VPLPEEFQALARQVTNWGRWGPADERGTLNLITPQVVARAATCVRTGKRFSLALPLSAEGPQIGLVPGRINPVHAMIAVNAPMTDDPDAFRSSDDTVFMGLQAATHWDALAHVSYGGHLYNGHPADTVTTQGAARCGIDKVGALVGRGVLLDVARARGVARLEPGYAITAEDLDAAEALTRVRVEPGDIALVRTGQIQVLHAGDKMGYAFPSPGLSMATVPWLRERDVAAVATDNLTLEVYPGERDGVTLPVHLLHLVDMGLTQGQNFDLEELAADCADDGAYAFLLEASPQPFDRALGSPVNPVAVK
jgi:kynurenine formamidase